jgi:putative ABC transport system permease protein
MALARIIARRSLLQRPGRTLFSVLGIGLGIATVVGVVTLDYNTILGLSAVRTDAAAPDIELRAQPGAGSADRLRAIEGISQVSEFFQNDGVARVAPPPEEVLEERDVTRKVRVFAMPAADLPAYDVWGLAAGRALASDATRREVMVGGALAEALGIELGDTLWLSRPRRVGRKECVDGELVELDKQRDLPPEYDFEVVGLLTREGLARRTKGMVVFVDLAWGERLYEGFHVERRLWAKRDESVDVERVKQSLAATYSYEFNRGAVLGQAADERAFRTGVRMAGLLALVLGLFVIFHTLSMSLAERVREVGTLHALGATKAQVGRVFLLEAVLLAGAGAVVGLAGGVGLARGLQRAGVTTLGVGKHIPVFDVPWGTVLALAGAGFAIALIGSIYPLAALGGADAAAALRGEEALQKKRAALGFHLLYAVLLALVLPSLYLVIVPVVGEFTGELVSVLLGAVGFMALLIILSLVMPTVLTAVCAALTAPFTRWWPLAGRLAARAIRDAPARIGASAAAVALVTAGLVGLKGMTASLAGEVDVWAREAALGKVWVHGLPPTSYVALRDRLHEFGALAVEKGNARVQGSFLIVGAEVAELERFGPVAADPELARALRREHGMILSRRVARDLDYELGDPVQVEKANGELQTFTVVAISDAYGHWPDPDERMYGVIADAYIEQYFCIDTSSVTELAVRLGDDADIGVVEAAVRDVVPDAEHLYMRSGQDVLELHRRDISRDFVLFDILIFLTAALAGLGVLNGQLLAALERSKEVGVLKALGTTRRQVAGMVLLESAVVGLVGGLLGVALGAALTPVVVGALQKIAGLALPDVGAGVWVPLGLAGALAVSVAAGLYPVWRMNRVDAVRAVRTG